MNKLELLDPYIYTVNNDILTIKYARSIGRSVSIALLLLLLRYVYNN